MVEYIERLCPELQIHVLLDGRTFHERQVKVRKSGSGDNVSPRVSKSARMPDERGFIEPQVWSRIAQVDRLARHEVRPIECEKTSASIRQQRNDWTERIARLQIYDGRNSPPVDNAVEQSLLSLERQSVHTAQHKTLTRIEIR